MADAPQSADQVRSMIASRRFVVLLMLSAIVGVVVSLATWCFLELIYQIQQGVYVHLPSDFGYHHGPPDWWSLPFLAIAGSSPRWPSRGSPVMADTSRRRA